MISKTDRCILLVILVVLIFVVGQIVRKTVLQVHQDVTIPITVSNSDESINKPISRYPLIGKRNYEFDHFINKIKDDTKKANPDLANYIEKAQIQLLIGNFRLIKIYNAGLDADINNYDLFYIVIDSSFFHRLTSDEKMATIGHELGHLTSVIKIIRKIDINSADQLAAINEEIEADRVAAKYTSPGAVLSLLEKAYFEYYLRRESLYKIRDGRK